VGTNSQTKTRQIGQEGRRAMPNDVPALAANIFGVTTNKSNKTKQGRLAKP
jgi:hypothetical protein